MTQLRFLAVFRSQRVAREAKEMPLLPLGWPCPVSEVLGGRMAGFRRSAASWGAGLGVLAGLILGVVEERTAGSWVRDHLFQKEAPMGQRWEVRLWSLHRVDGAPASVQP